MHRHHIFTLGIILTSIYGINAMADWPTKPATNIWTDSNRSIPAMERCSDCCKTDCWLPGGTYYDNVGTFTETCTGEPSEPTCDANKTYSIVNGVCKGKLSCPSGQYDIGFGSCISASTNGSDYGYWGVGGNTYNTTTYDLAAGGLWAVEFSYGVVKGITSCNSTNGKQGVATTTEFSNTANGQYCWCKMTEPSASRWVFLSSVDPAEACGFRCAYYCAYNVKNSSASRSGMFGSVE